MAQSENLIQISDRGGINFGDYRVEEKLKQDNFEFEGDIYKVKTHNQITRLEKNGRLLYESVAGTEVTELSLTDDKMAFSVFSDREDAQITVELEVEQEYKVLINDVQVGKVKSNLSGKISFSVDFSSGIQRIEIIKIK